MDNRIYYGEYSLAYWIELILTKQLILPPYQRYYVWNKQKLRTLVDSIINMRFVPPVTIGSFLKDGKRVNYIIDGQQRLTSLLLAYLNRFPNRECYKATTGILAGSADSLDPTDDSSSPLDDVLHWRFDQLTEKGSCSEDILKALNAEQYGPIYKEGETCPITRDNASKLFLGFSYIVPSTESSAEQQEYYTKVFRDINQQASHLLLTESRKSLYFIKEGLDSYFIQILWNLMVFSLQQVRNKQLISAAICVSWLLITRLVMSTRWRGDIAMILSRILSTISVLSSLANTKACLVSLQMCLQMVTSLRK